MAQLANLTTTFAMESAAFVNGAEVSRAALARLTRQLDPAGTAQAKFNAQTRDLKAALDAGVISGDKYASMLGNAEQRLQRVIAAQQQGTAASGQMRAGFQQLGFQLGDISTGLSSGQKGLTIFAQQSSQVVQALQLMTGESKGFLSVLSNPWTLIATSAVVALAPLVAKLFEGNQALDEQIDKLKKSAAQTDIARQAKQVFRNSEEGVSAAIRDQAEALKEQQDNLRSAAAQAAINAKFNLLMIQQTRDHTRALLENAQAQIEVQRVQSQGPGQRGELATLGLDTAQNRLDGLRAKLIQNETDLKTAQDQVTATLANLAQEQAKIAGDAIASITRKYEGPNGLIEQAKNRLTAEHATTAEIAAQLALIYKREQAEKDAAQKAKSSSNNNRQSGRDITLPEAEKIVSNIGGVITSATRSFEKQTQLYNNYLAGKGPLAAKPGTSDHETGNALDIAKTPGMSLAKIRQAFTDAGVSIKQLLDEGNHFHVAWKSGADGAAKAEKDLADTLGRVTGSLDPAEAAARKYRAALADIDKLVKAGAISPDQAAIYRAVAYQNEMAEKYPQIVAEGKRAAEAERKFADEAQRANDALEKRADRILTDQKASIVFGNQLLTITTLNAAERNKELAHLSAIAELQRDSIPLESEQGKQILFNAEQLEKLRQKQDLFNASLDEANRFGDQFLSDVLDPQNWNNWGDAGKRILQDLESEFVKLALLNPLKNMLFGESNPTLSSVGGIFSKLLGGSSSLANVDLGWGPSGIATTVPDVSSILSGLPSFASGGSFTFGGRDGVDRNVLSLNGSPIANVSKGETATIGRGGAGANVVTLLVQANDYFDAKVGSVSAGVSTNIVGENNRIQARAASRRLR